jgi:signal transduction histidine kinase/CheY-like chemotaxis protein
MSALSSPLTSSSAVVNATYTESVLRAVSDSKTKGIFVLNQQGDVLFSNATAGKLLGMRTDQMVSKPFRDIVPLVLRDNFDAKWRVLMGSTESKVQFSALFQHGDNHTPVDFSIKRIEGREPFYRVKCKNAAEKEKDGIHTACEALRLSDQKMLAIGCDKSGKMRFVSSNLPLFAKCPAVAWVEKNVSEMIVEEDWTVFHNAWTACATSGREKVKVRIMSGNHEPVLMCFELISKPTLLSDEWTIFVTFPSLDEKEEEDVLGTVIRQFSHDMRTGVFALQQNLQCLEETPLSETQRGYVKAMEGVSSTVEELLEDLLYESCHGGKMNAPTRVFSLFDSLGRMCASFNAQSASHCVRIVPPVFEESVPDMIRAQRVAVKRVFLNLVSNAIKYNVKNGQVSVHVRCREKDVEEGRKRLFVEIDVTDTGLGISEDDLSRIFHPYFRSSRTRDQVEGTGVGLYGCKQLLEKMGGSLSVRSELQKGSTFTFRFPIERVSISTAAAPAEASAVAVQAEALPLILVVDDVLFLTRMWEKILASEGGRCVCVNTAKDAVANLLANNDGFDMCLLDWHIGDVTADQVIADYYKERGGKGKPVQFLITSGSGEEEIKEEITRNRRISLSMIAGILQKPVPRATVHRLVESCIERPGKEPPKGRASPKEELDPSIAGKGAAQLHRG